MQRSTSNPIPRLSTLLQDEPTRYLQPTLGHQQLALNAAKSILDPLAQSIIEAQTTRRDQNRRKRKRGSDEVDDLPILQLRQVYTSGLGVKQVWEQARRVLDAAYDEIERDIEQHIVTDENSESGTVEVNGTHEDLDLESDLASDSVEEELDDQELEDEEEDENDPIAEDLEDELVDEADGFSEAESNESTEQVEVFKPDPNKLNDGFFSIDDFNRQSQFLEQMDARGDEENPSDEDEIDWDADPMSQVIPPQQNGEDASVDEDGPTFGNVDLNADTDEELDDGLDDMMPDLDNTNEIKYSDFFAPPPRPVKSRRARLPKTQPPKETPSTALHGQQPEDDLERAMEDIRRDLLDSEDDMEDDDLSGSDSDAQPKSSRKKNQNLSTHEKQQLELADEIRRLEAVNVSKKPWILSGEASAGARPMNSLIEEDLEFERTGKPVPVITAEISNDIESLIKRRILARDFDELIRRGPNTLSDGTRRGRADVVVDDTKPQTGLGEVYEAEYQRNADPTSYIDKRSAATTKQHEEIDRLWVTVRDQLDVLGNLHFKPKREEINVKVVEDKPRITMEDARPAISGIEEEAMLAPQDIYKPGTDSRAARGEVLNESGLLRNKEEMTREEKTRIRRREKERLKKSQTTQKANVVKSKSAKKADDQQAVLKDLEKGGVKVIGKDGQLKRLGAKGSGKTGLDVEASNKSIAGNLRL